MMMSVGTSNSSLCIFPGNESNQVYTLHYIPLYAFPITYHY